MKRLAVFIPACLLAFFLSNATAQNSNTTVRFRIYYGSYLFGDLDVELFDQAKPVTVSNFLAYVKSGRYQNSFLHRLIPNFIVQGGEWTLPAPYSGEVVQNVTRVPTYGPIPNEFLVGPRLTNSFGTIAMAKLDGDPDSASSSWFININNNGFLDEQNGGFTVFGRVKAGTNYLGYFNALSKNNGILDMSSSLYTNFCPPFYQAPEGVTDYPFKDLPVQFTGFFDCPYYNDLFRVQIIVLNDRDLSPAKLTILSPKANGSVTNEVLITGKVSENRAMKMILLYLETNNPVVATLSTNGLWSATLNNVPPGTNTLIVEAVDDAGNLSGIAQKFFYSVPEPLNVEVIGNGTVAGATNSQILELGRGYTLVARPDPGNLFSGWTGPLTQAGLSYSFIMETNLFITATFLTNLFPNVKGTYTGLFYDSNQVEQQGSGFLTLTVGDLGSYTAKLSLNGKTHPVRGTFSPEGKETNLVVRTGTDDLLLRLSLDLDGGTEQITGSVATVSTNLGWFSTIVADRNIARTTTEPALEAGKYTFLLPEDPGAANSPPGDSFGNVTVSSKGSLTLSGSLADGTKVVQKAMVSKDGTWPLYVSLYRGKGALVGWVNFTNETGSDLKGLLNWFKQSQSNARIYPSGFTNEAVLLGSRFVVPTLTDPMLDLTEATVAFTDAHLAEDFANTVDIDPFGKVINSSTNKLTLSISRSTGLFTGSVTPPTTAPRISFKGAILQKQNRGGGYFLNLTNSGAVEIYGE